MLLSERRGMKNLIQTTFVSEYQVIYFMTFALFFPLIFNDLS